MALKSYIVIKKTKAVFSNKQVPLCSSQSHTDGFCSQVYQFNQHAHYALEVTTNVVKAVNLKHHRVHLMDFIVTMTSPESI